MDPGKDPPCLRPGANGQAKAIRGSCHAPPGTFCFLGFFVKRLLFPGSCLPLTTGLDLSFLCPGSIRRPVGWGLKKGKR
jgi:hypothetical protein